MKKARHPKTERIVEDNNMIIQDLDFFDWTFGSSIVKNNHIQVQDTNVTAKSNNEKP
jgi:hypothetical protein